MLSIQLSVTLYTHRLSAHSMGLTHCPLSMCAYYPQTKCPLPILGPSAHAAPLGLSTSALHRIGPSPCLTPKAQAATDATTQPSAPHSDFLLSACFVCFFVCHYLLGGCAVTGRDPNVLSEG